MIQKVFGVRDAKALAFLQPFFSVSVGAAIRAFSDAVNEDVKSPLGKHPEDYVLYELASFDDNTGEFVCTNPIKMLGCGSDFRELKPKFGDISDDVVMANKIAVEMNGKKNG